MCRLQADSRLLNSLDMRKITLLLASSLTLGSAHGQFYSEPEKAKVAGTGPPGDSITYVATGFVLNATIGPNRGRGNDGYFEYLIYSPSGYYDYAREYADLENAYGYCIGVSPGFHGRKYGLEFPLSYNMVRYKVPELGSFRVKLKDVEFGLLNYFKFGKERCQFLLGVSAGSKGSLYSTLGFGVRINKKLAVNLRMHTASRVSYVEYSSRSEAITDWNANTWQLLVTYDLVNLRKEKTVLRYKKKTTNYNSNNNSWTPPPPPPPPAAKPKIDYSGYSDAELRAKLKEANATDNLDAMLGIQKELDRRAASNALKNDSNEQLQKKLDAAIEKEDFKQAEIIKQELKRRGEDGGQRKQSNNLENKSVEELKKLLDQAIANEDYEKAKEIQDLINSKSEK
jgi:hypothetical protein